MNITTKTVDEIAYLARLEFNNTEKEGIVNDMNKMLAFVEQLNKANTDGVAPLIYLTQEHNVLRKDIAEVTITQKEALMNAPKKDSDYFKVPKVIG
jgi:aspartyl-tRNA(Asn)/glutamyl-tRNA(Gln) amidotransferase subunit C